jgi:hypothetical protein
MRRSKAERQKHREDRHRSSLERKKRQAEKEYSGHDISTSRKELLGALAVAAERNPDKSLLQILHQSIPADTLSDFVYWTSDDDLIRGLKVSTSTPQPSLKDQPLNATSADTQLG